MESFGLEIRERDQNRQAGHAVQQEFPEAGVAVDDDQIAERRQTEIEDTDLAAGQSDAKGQAPETEPGQEFFPRVRSHRIQDKDKAGRSHDDQFRKNDKE